MDTTTLSSKGQIIIPKAVRDAYGWREGTVFVVEEVANGILLRPERAFPRTQLKDVIGCAGYKGPSRTIEEMDEAVLAEARRRFGGKPKK
ncbi:MAG: AbrB/MazE/SpoVT family DNA-binding domain-containing protein [Hyphomicrobiaceae bacterium]